MGWTSLCRPLSCDLISPTLHSCISLKSSLELCVFCVPSPSTPPLPLHSLPLPPTISYHLLPSLFSLPIPSSVLLSSPQLPPHLSQSWEVWRWCGRCIECTTSRWTLEWRGGAGHYTHTNTTHYYCLHNYLIYYVSIIHTKKTKASLY